MTMRLSHYFLHFPAAEATKTTMHERYARQIILPHFGESSQAALQRAKVLVIGAGGLGCPALQYLAAAGVGMIGIVDDDRVELSNLHRQVLFTEDDIGKNKAKVAGEKLRKINAKLTVQIIENKVHLGNAADILSKYDVVIDGSDNFRTRYLVNDVCALLNIPLVYGSVFRYEGQVSVFHVRDSQPVGRPANYRDLFPIPPALGEVPNCLEAGVIGVLTGIIGTMQASEAIKLITGIGEVLASKVLTYSMLSNSMEIFEFAPHPEALSSAPGTLDELRKMQYESFCSNPHDVHEITWEDLDEHISKEEMLLLDVREADELPHLEKYSCISIPLRELRGRLHELHSAQTIVVFCQSGNRSKVAVRELQQLSTFRQVWSIQGGIAALVDSRI
jgi:molybdopterin/thiamine biosynthesis adenylyltransferase/rhodanese-related sulfurtransferase